MFRVRVIPGLLMLSLFVIGQPEIVAYFFFAAAVAVFATAMVSILLRGPGVLLEPVTIETFRIPSRISFAR